MRNKIRRIRNRYYLLLDLVVFIIVPFLLFAIRFEGFNFSTPLNNILLFSILFGLLKIAVLYFTGIYSRWWAQASIDDLLQLIYAGIIILLLQFGIIFTVRQTTQIFLSRIPYSIVIFDAIISTFFIAHIRLIPRITNTLIFRFGKTTSATRERVLIVGAGEAGVMVLEEIKRQKEVSTSVIGFIDSDTRKIGMKMRGIKVLGDKYAIPGLVERHRIDKVIIAMPSAPGKEIKDIVDICSKVDKLTVQTLPALYEIIDGRVEINKLRKVQIDDLLRREPIKTDLDLISSLIEGKNVLVTGAGGSIGGEICRQVLRVKPAKLFILGHGENSIFEIELELRRKFPKAVIESFIADIKDYHRLKRIFTANKIDFIFHAAAHKHVPFMESHPYEAIRNNILGTKNIVDLAIQFELEKLIMISTDKAVNPTSVMGATKRIAEMYVINAAKKFKNKFSVVRFGNVLGSRGSVVKIFLSQIEKGADITITHPDIERYFMTIPEAVQLVLQAFIMGNGGDIFVFDMGKPVKIIDLAHDLIRLSGLTVGEDISIVTTGLRPGEKLYEELFNKDEKFNNTRNEKIFIAENSEKIIIDNFEEKLDALLVYTNSTAFDSKNCINYLRDLVPGYNSININAEKVNKI